MFYFYLIIPSVCFGFCFCFFVVVFLFLLGFFLKSTPASFFFLLCLVFFVFFRPPVYRMHCTFLLPRSPLPPVCPSSPCTARTPVPPPRPHTPSTPALSLLVQLFSFFKSTSCFYHFLCVALESPLVISFFLSLKRCVSWSVRRLCVLSLVYVVPACACARAMCGGFFCFFSSASVTVHATTLVPGYCGGACWGAFYLKLL